MKLRQNPLLRVEEGSWLLKPTPSWKGSVALMMVWATVSPFLQVSVPPQYLHHIYIIYNISTPYLHCPLTCPRWPLRGWWG